MKLIFIILSTFIFFGFKSRPDSMPLTNVVATPKSINEDSFKLHIINNSSLRRLPSVLRDLSIALNKSSFQREGLLNENGFDIDLHDIVCKSFDTSATVTLRPDDTIFYLKLNRFNEQASDGALAVTLIHEIMHCVLLDIDKRGRLGDEKALAIIECFNQKIKNPFGHATNNFFSLMNGGDGGQHELMYQLFYQDMVLLLEQFAQIHRNAFLRDGDAGLLMWSGLQMTSGFQKLDFEEKQQIEFAIVSEKRIPISLLDY